jgi:hypothetical protein
MHYITPYIIRVHYGTGVRAFTGTCMVAWALPPMSVSYKLCMIDSLRVLEIEETTLPTKIRAGRITTICLAL